MLASFCLTMYIKGILCLHGLLEVENAIANIINSLFTLIAHTAGMLISLVLSLGLFIDILCRKIA